jgi:hypothetical protein
MPADFPPHVDRALVGERLQIIFPEGTPHRNYCTRDLAASTVFTALYIGAIEGSELFLGPKHVYRMTERQAIRTDDGARRRYAADALKPGFRAPGKRWYADNTREPIRDETLREGLVAVGAVVARMDIPTTSSKPRYALKAGFAALFNPALTGTALEAAVRDWQMKNLSPGVLARVSLVRDGAAAAIASLKVTFPNGEARLLAPGPSSVITKAVVESFAPRFLDHPAVLWLSESGNKVAARDDKLAAKIGLKIEADKNLPDLILVDLGPHEPLIVFIEIVATDGPITARRRAALLDLTDAARFARTQVVFVTAYQDRNSSAFKRTISELAWGSFAWFASEPEQIVALHDGTTWPMKLAKLLENGRP